MRVVLMGVSGSGKTTLGQRVAVALGWDFQDGDALHPAANVAKMRAGQPLTDADREPWLARVGAWLKHERARERNGVVACSALKRAYRDSLRQDDPNLRLVYLRVPRDVLRWRMHAREHAFMPESLLDSQLATLEEPAPDEGALVIDGADDIDRSVAVIEHVLGQR